MTASLITVGELQRMLQGIDGNSEIRLVVMDDLCKEIKMSGRMDYIIKPTVKGQEVVFYAGGEAQIGE